MKNVKAVPTERQNSANYSVQDGQSYSLNTNESSEENETNHFSSKNSEENVTKQSSSESCEQIERKYIEDHNGSSTNSAESFAATAENNGRIRPQRKKLCRHKFFYSSVLFFVAAISILLFALASSHKTALDCYETNRHTVMEMKRIVQDIKLGQKELKNSVLLMQNDSKEEFLLMLESILHKILLFNYISLQKNSTTMQDSIVHQQQHMTEEMLLMVKQFKYTERAKSTDQPKLHESIDREYSLKSNESEYPEKVDKLIPSEEKFVSYAYQPEHMAEERSLMVKKLKYGDVEEDKSTDQIQLYEFIDHEYSLKSNETEYPEKAENLISSEDSFVSYAYQQEHITEEIPLIVKKLKYVDAEEDKSTDQIQLYEFIDHEYSLKSNETEYPEKAGNLISSEDSFVSCVSYSKLTY
ncbi:uncharacterized protein LOC118192808 [Stegodyphus dumicola]|uniref:uncharacterized protein LOC118192808 n=1 Tax=Stegodyphus dumicola TaxID=202533 RepID=UPI0015A9799D|nr:uncharacterized protein LOC118192808 [Stegodyphus dumicola]